MKELNELIDFYEMTGDEPQLLVMLIELRRHRMDNWKQHAETAEAKLAELEKQEPVFQIEVSGNHWLNAGPVDDSDFTGLPDGINLLYARPAPAINLAELVPDVEENERAFTAGLNALVNCLEDCGDAEQGLRLALRASRAAILRNIEEQSP